ncbi:MAG: PAS domain S-box protein [Nitrospirae bacterium]|nr:PAS domain S-box protein [Nitrospirota bacterium]
MPEKAINAYFRIGLKLLVAIGCTELLIMTVFRWIRIETWLSPFLIDLTDALLLCVTASFLILYWVVKPMKILEERERAAVLCESESHLRIVLESTADGILAVDHRGKVLWANARFFELWLIPKTMTGLEDDQRLLEQVLTQLADPEAFLKKVQELYASEKVSFDTLYLKGGRIFERYSCALMSDGKNVGRLWSFRDITERKRSEEALQALTLRYKAILAAVPDIIMEVDKNKVYTWANKAGYEFFSDDVIGREAAFYFEGEQQTHNIVQPLFSGSDDVIYMESLQRRKDGEKRLLAWWCRVLKDSEGNVTGVLSTARDITEHKQAEVERDRLVAIIEATTDLVGFSDPAGHFLYLNPAARILLGVGVSEDITSTSIADFIPNPASHPVLTEGFPTAIRQGMWTGETVLLNRRGQEFPISQVILAHKTADGKLYGLSTIMRDITERKQTEEEKLKLEAQLRHAQKMEAVGTLAGGIAHDFNNILNVIIGYGTMLLDRMEADNLSKEQMNEVLMAAERAANLTRGLLAFSRKQVVEVKPVNINETILGIQKMLVRIIRENIDFKLNLADRPLIVMADTGQIEQVLMNLAINAKDAMPEGGHLTISTGLQELDDEYAAAYGYGKPGMYALITVDDTGHGMDAETRNKIFEPFYTTKGIGEGTGLGLAISYGIIKQHNGYMNVYSEPGQGSEFKIYLPLIEDAATLGKKTGAAVPAKGGNETILIAEDDASLRKLSRMVLEAYGYSVITAEDGEDALTKFIENRDKIQLVILDMIMPKKNGKEAGEAIRKESPLTKILFMSGYTMDIIKTSELTEAGFDFILKPVVPKDFLKKVREVLDK